VFHCIREKKKGIRNMYSLTQVYHVTCIPCYTLMPTRLDVQTLDALHQATAFSLETTWFPGLQNVRPRCLSLVQIRSTELLLMLLLSVAGCASCLRSFISHPFGDHCLL
jgi:hypothetical protein